MPHVTIGLDPNNPSALGGAVDLYFELLDTTRDQFLTDPAETDPSPRRRPRGWYGTNDNFMLWEEYAQYVRNTVGQIVGAHDKDDLKFKIYQRYRANEHDQVVQDIAKYFKKVDDIARANQHVPEPAEAPTVAFWLRGICKFAQVEEPVVPEEPKRPAQDPYPTFTDDPELAHEERMRAQHRPWTRPEYVEIRERGVLPFNEFHPRLYELGAYSDGFDLRRNTNLSKMYFAYAVMNVNANFHKVIDFSKGKNIDWNNGWSNSYHDADWLGYATIWAWDETPEGAKATLDAALAHITPGEDPTKQRMDMRRLVRPGD